MKNVPMILAIFVAFAGILVAESPAAQGVALRLQLFCHFVGGVLQTLIGWLEIPPD